MLTSLKITGFRAFESLTIEDLGRVNLFVGENGSGKTAVLEAVELLVKGALRSVLAGQLKSRKEYLYRKGDKGESSLLDVRHLFHGHELEDGTRFSINDRRVVVFDPSDLIPDSACVTLEGATEDPIQMPLSPEGGISSHQPVSLNPKTFTGRGTPHFARFPSLGRDDLSEMWDDISLSPLEEQVIEAARIIDPRLLGIRTLQNGEVVVKVEGVEKRLPLGTLGEGFAQMLVVALAVADSEGSTALIDEIDTGLHYSVMEKMWRMVIETARRLDVQVFATTHSLDCINALGSLYRTDSDLASEVRLHRIEKGYDKTVVLRAEHLDVAEKQSIEVR